MSYAFPFVQGMSVIELGGGDTPQIRPNVDFRPGPTVDVVADLNGKLPLESNAYDGVLSSYSLEHVSWRNVKGFLREVSRILKPGGRAVFIIPNLYEQAKILASREDWEENDICMVFGDQNYQGNYHSNGFSPAYAFRVFRECGFSDTLILPHPATVTDMVVEAKKPEHEFKPEEWTPAERKQYYNRLYFDGGRGQVGGYARSGYADYPVHWKTFNEIMTRKPESVLEIGCARGYILKRIEDAGLKAKGLEVSNHCIQTKAIDDVVEFDITQTPWPVEDGAFDLCFSIAVMEHIPEGTLEAVAAEMKRTCKRGLHGIDFGEHDDGFDKTHCTLRSKEWWTGKLPEGHEIVDKESLEKGEIKLPVPDSKVKLNVGSFTTMFHNGWINMDVHPLQEFAKGNGYIYRQHDVVKGLPYDDGCVDMIYACHFLEHLDYHAGLTFLRETFRVLRKGGVMRLLLPNAEGLIRQYIEGTLGEYDELNDGCANSPAPIAKLWSLLFSGHNSMYDWETLRDTLREVAGYTDIHQMSFRKSVNDQMLRETLDVFPTLSLFVDVVR